MKHFLATAVAGFALATGTGYAQETPSGQGEPNPPPSGQPQPAPPQPEQAEQPPRTHIDTTVLGSARSGDPDAPADAAGLESDHHFEAGAPDLVSITNRLSLAARQKAQIQAAIERADAGAAVLIKRERDVREMLAATTPEDPLYAQLVTEQSAAGRKWTENRESLRREVLDVLTPAQRARFEQLRTQQ